MELDFRETPLSYLQTVLWETVTQEETIETIVPDAMPDVETVTDGFALACLRSRDCQDGTLSLSGDIQGGILYMAQGEDTPRMLSIYAPFSLRRPAPEAEQCCITCRVTQVDATLRNSRKVSIRITLCLHVQAWKQQEEALFTPGEPLVPMQFREYPMTLLGECTQKELLLRETAPQSGAQRVLHTAGWVQMQEEKLAGSQGICKGELQLQILFSDMEDKLQTQEFSLPFSQVIDLSDDYETDTGLWITPVLTALDCTVQGDSFAVEAGLCLQACAYHSVMVPVVADAYALQGELTLDRREYGMVPELEHRRLHQELHQSLPINAAEILHAQAMPDAPKCTWADGAYQIQIPVQLSLCYRDTEGAVRLSKETGQVSVTVPGAKGQLQLTAVPCGTCFAAPMGGGVEVRQTICLSCCFLGEERLSTICGGEYQPSDVQEERPCLIVRTLTQDTELWTLAKELRTTVSAIAIANDMDGDTAPAGTMLLIPIVA